MNPLDAIPAISGLWKTIFGDKAASNRQLHNEQMAVYNQFAQEFGHSKNWWDSLIDGLNRLPRPLFTFGTIGLFAWCGSDPESFTVFAIALQAMPEPGWWLLGIVVTFWFGGKIPKDLAKFSVGASTLEVAKQVKKARKSFATSTDTTEHEELNWGDRVEKRYKDWDNLNN